MIKGGTKDTSFCFGIEKRPVRPPECHQRDAHKGTVSEMTKRLPFYLQSTVQLQGTNQT